MPSSSAGQNSYSSTKNSPVCVTPSNLCTLSNSAPKLIIRNQQKHVRARGSYFVASALLSGPTMRFGSTMLLASAFVRPVSAFVSLRSPAAALVPATRWGSMSVRAMSTEGGGEGEEEAPTGEFTELSRLEIRTGKVLEVSKHPSLPKIFVEKIDVGEDEPRTICSGLVGLVEESELLGANCVVLCNLKPRDMEGVPSIGMLLAASSADDSEVKLLLAPGGCAPGELVTFEGHTAEPMEPGNRAVKVGWFGVGAWGGRFWAVHAMG
mmetsp:Transcript_938/g.1829  ORF Transcript_938/g.1829 Transcript_938/m.1829 type:complete len:266 (+) Transcript_938:114-911(+)